MISLHTNVSAMNASRHMNNTNTVLAKATERLSSGLRINRAADDASGLFAAESLTTQIRSGNAAVGNIQQAISVAEIADQAMSAIADTLQRMRELAVAANSGLITADQASALDDEFQVLDDAIDDIVQTTEYGGDVVLDGTFAGVTLQVGPDSAATATLDIASLAGDIPVGGDVLSQANAATAITNVDAALDALNIARATVGAQVSALTFQKSALETTIVAHADARSRIRDADIATEVSNLVSAQIRQQAGASALSAANFSAQFVLQLLQ